MAFIGNTPTTQAFTPAVDYFSGTGSATAFTLSRPVASVAQVQVVVNNVAQNPSSAYTVSSNTITFTSAPSSGTNNIYVYYTSPITQVIAPGQGTVNTTALAGGTVTTTADATLNGLTVGKGGGSVSTNTAVGASALQANTTGSNATVVGYQAGYTTTVGLRQSFFGSQAGYYMTDENTSVGYRALYGASGSTGYYNVAVGRYALNVLTTGQSNVAIGDNALQAHTSGIENTAVGYQALNSNTTASYNTAVGRNSLVNCTTGTHNTVIGHNSGDTITTGTKNTILGRYNGNQGGLDIRTSSNRVVLSDGDGNPRLYADNNGAWQSTSAVGNGTLYPAQFCRAWVFFNCSNAAISGSANVSSITRISAGSYTVNFTTAFPDVNYTGVSGFCRIDATPQFVNMGFDRGTTYDRVETFVNGSFADLSKLGLAYFR